MLLHNKIWDHSSFLLTNDLLVSVKAWMDGWMDFQWMSQLHSPGKKGHFDVIIQSLEMVFPNANTLIGKPLMIDNFENIAISG